MNLEEKYLEDYSEKRYLSCDNQDILILEPFRKKNDFISRRKIANKFFQNKIIQQIIERTLAINRVDFLSRYHEHNDSPSARNLHSTELIFVYKEQAYYYDLFDQQMYFIGETQNDDLINEELYIIGIHSLKNLSRYYGEFSLYLSLLDGGHIFANLKNYLQRENYQFEQTVEFRGSDLLRDIGIFDSGVFISFALKVFTQVLNREPIFIERPTNKNLELYDYYSNTYHIKKLIEKYSIQKTKITWRIIEFKNCKVFENKIYKNRSSHHNMVGNYNKLEDYSSFSIFKVLTYLEEFKKNLFSDAVNFAFIKKTKKGLKIFRNKERIENIEGSMSLILNNDHDFFDLESYTTVFVSYGDRKKVLSNGLISHFLSVGEVTQFVGGYAAENQYGFRPMKNHNDKYLKKILKLDSAEDIHYIGVLCDETVKQINVYL